MNRDISDLATTVRRLDVSSTLRAFVALFAVVFTWLQIVPSAHAIAQGIYRTNDAADPETAVLMYALLSLAAVAPLTFIAIDWMSRKPWRGVSGAIALGSGAFGQVLLAGAVIGMGALMMGLVSPDEADDNLDGATEALSILLVAAYLAPMAWLSWRTVQIETVLAGPSPRGILVGSIKTKSFWARLAFLLGMPSSMWSLRALERPSFWLLLTARPVIYVALLTTLTLGNVLLDIGRADGLIVNNDDSDDSGEYSDNGAPCAFADGTLDQDCFQREFAGTPSAFYFPVALRAAARVKASLILVMSGITLGVFSLGHILFALGKRLASRRIWDKERHGDAPPILFLRSFADDRVRFRRPRVDLIGHWIDLWSFRRNADELLIDEFAQYGPVIALGVPGERAAPFGAARRYTSDAEWQQVIRDAAGRAQAIVIAAGETPGLGWEYELIAQEGLLDKTIALFPPTSRGKAAALHAFERFAASFPAAQIAFDRERDSPIAFMHRRGKPALLTARHARAEAYVAALRSFFQIDAS